MKDRTFSLIVLKATYAKLALAAQGHRPVVSQRLKLKYSTNVTVSDSDQIQVMLRISSSDKGDGAKTIGAIW